MGISSWVWSTYREMLFLDGLGTFRDPKDKPADLPGRDELLRRYKATMRERADWGPIEKEKIEQYLAEVEPVTCPCCGQPVHHRRAKREGA